MLAIDKFGTHDGKPVWRAKMTAGDLSAEIISFGAITKCLKLKNQELILGHGDFGSYKRDATSMGVIAGRVGNRIAFGRFRLNGIIYELEKNDGEHHLHGGSAGFGKCNWTMEKDSARNAVQLTYASDHLEAGYPGKLDIRLQICLTENGISYIIDAIPSDETPVNLLQHNYYSLGADGLDHRLQVNADRYCVSDSSLIPTGEVLEPTGAMDFRTERRIGDAMLSAAGIDNNFILNDASGPSATLSGPLASLQFRTNQPGLQIYTGQSLTKPFRPFQGVCLEPQYFPNCVNEPSFPSCIHSPDNPYHQDTAIKIVSPAS